MTEPTSLAERRWDTKESPADHSVADMLRVALGRIERGEIKPDHAVLCLGKIDDGVSRAEYMQAGTYLAFAQVGLLDRAKALLVAGS
jgi:hypothetical protein